MADVRRCQRLPEPSSTKSIDCQSPLVQPAAHPCSPADSHKQHGRAGLEYLHQRHVVHFDVKTDNLLGDLRDLANPVVKIADMGLSKRKASTFVSGNMRGTLPWMAPELFPNASALAVCPWDAVQYLASQSHKARPIRRPRPWQRRHVRYPLPRHSSPMLVPWLHVPGVMYNKRKVKPKASTFASCNMCPGGHKLIPLLLPWQ